jgi:hypothetical protein
VRSNNQCGLCNASIAIGAKITGVSLMPMNDSSSEQPRTADNTKKAYEKPAFRYEQVFVTTALSCGKITSSQSGCGLNQSAS